MDYPVYQQQGWPIGSGSVESSHKFVVQSRLKGSGMHWKPEHINPMLALRLALLNERWEEAWQEQHRLRRHQHHLKRQTRQQQRFREQQAKRQESHPPSLPVASTPKPTPQKTGRTEAQYRWGRQTISPRMLEQASGAKNEPHTGESLRRHRSLNQETLTVRWGIHLVLRDREDVKHANTTGVKSLFWESQPAVFLA